MAANLTGQVRAVAEVTTAVARGDLSLKVLVVVIIYFINFTYRK